MNKIGLANLARHIFIDTQPVVEEPNIGKSAILLRSGKVKVLPVVIWDPVDVKGVPEKDLGYTPS